MGENRGPFPWALIAIWAAIIGAFTTAAWLAYEAAATWLEHCHGG